MFTVPNLDASEAMAAAAGWPRIGDRINCFEAIPAWREHFESMLEAVIGPVGGVGVTLFEARSESARVRVE